MPNPTSDSIPTPSLTSPQLRHSYRIGRGEQLVLTFEPYKSYLLPLWRFRTPSIARSSASALESRFHAYEAAGDFVGMDMTRKFLQMGMTRAKRYARHKGGRKYGKDGKELAVSEGHEGRDEKMEASRIFGEAWERVKRREGYKTGREEWERDLREWGRRQKKGE